MLRFPRMRRILLSVALLVTVVASVWPRAQETSVGEVVVPAAQRESPPAEQASPTPAPSNLPSLGSRKEQRQTAPEVRDLFGSKSWNPPPPPPQAKRAPAVPAPPPAPPPFPYAVVGSIVDTNGVMVMFTNQQQNLIVRIGEVFASNYRVDAVDPESVTLTYIPLGMTQRVPLPVLN